MNYPYTTTIRPSVFTVMLLQITLFVYCGRYRSVFGVLPFAIACPFAALWSFGSVMEVAEVDLATKIFWFKFKGAGQLTAATATTCFVLEYAWLVRKLTRRNLALLSIPYLLSFGLILINDFHHLIWRGFVFEGKVYPLRDPSNWILVVLGMD